MEYLFDYGLFLAQTITFVVAVLLLMSGIVAISQRRKAEQEGHIEVHKVNDKYKDISDTLNEAVTDQQGRKALLKARNKSDKATAKAAKKQRKKGEDAVESTRKRLYVLDFDGDMRASATDQLREEVSAVLPHIRDGDEILLRLESPGGLVHGYGLAASQLKRITDAGAPLTIAVDKVAASGGYMMACVAPHIIAAPFAVLGSIGVLAQLPNFHRLLKKHDIDFELLTAGEYKRTLTLFGENTDKGREKFMEDLEITHKLFKAFVAENRPTLDIDKVATGEIWYGSDALKMGLIDALQTSDAFVQEQLKNKDVFEVRYAKKKHWQEKLGLAASGAVERSVLKLWQHNSGPHS
ncbi:protease SohB [Kineobactrum sediminis]|uniref:Protease SohB n=1 Tax=Kineobactrum sediminis TaxID=1905677 RepID=A0A2N5Y139_9GAMM|nr:protease SohB [Kineobactrum sediminis]PLW82101.1 protease SohB [Kineobactrum sediminis]